MTILRLLILDDSADTALLLVDHLRRGGYDVTFLRVDTMDTLRRALAEGQWDVVLADERTTAVSVEAALALLQGAGTDLPFITVSASDLRRLVPAIEQELRDVEERRKRAQAEEALRDSEKRYRALVEGIPVGVYRVGLDGSLLDANAVCLELLGLRGDRVPAGFNMVASFADPAERDRWRAVTGRGKPLTGREIQLRRADGTRIWVRDTGRAARGSGGTVLWYDGVLEDITTLRAAEEESRRTEARFRALIEYATDIVTVTDAAGILRYHSPSGHRLLGYEQGETLGRGLIEYVHPDDVDAIHRLIERGIADPQFIGRVTYRFRHKDGSWRYLESIGRSLLDEPSVRGLVINSRDVTERVRMEHELRRRVQELRCLYAVSTLLAQARPEVGCQQVVDAVPSGWRYPELAGARLVVEACDHATAGFRSTPWRLEAPIVVDRETVGSLEVCYRERPSLAETEDVFLDEERMLLASIADQIAATVRRRRAEEALVSREARFRSLIENSSDLIAILDANRRTLYVSPAHERVLGFSVDEAMACELFDLIHPEDRATVSRTFLDLVHEAAGSTRSVPFRARHKDGSWKHVESTATNLLHDPAIAGVVVNSRDVTERVRLEEQFRQAQKMEAVGRLAGGVAHDFNNLLTVIDGNAVFLLEALGVHDPRRQDVQEIKRAGERAASLTRQLLAFSRRQVIQPRVLDVNAIVADMDKMVRRLIGEDIEFVTALADRVDPVLADAGQVEQVFLNLVVNARDAMPHGGKLAVETRNVELDAAYCAEHDGVRAGRYVMIAVSDTGEGIPRETQPHIFEPFFTTKTGGTGLGLATVYGIATQSGGHVSLESEPGHGAAFRVFLPATDETAGPHPTGEWAVPLVPSTETVLLVEDEPGVRAVTTRVLREAGYSVLVAAAGREALEVAGRHDGPIHLLMTDVIMPQMSGPELANALTERRPGVKILYVSGYTDESIAHLGVLAPGMSFLGKPFTPDAILRKVRHVLDT